MNRWIVHADRTETERSKPEQVHGTVLPEDHQQIVIRLWSSWLCNWISIVWSIESDVLWSSLGTPINVNLKEDDVTADGQLSIDLFVCFRTRWSSFFPQLIATHVTTEGTEHTSYLSVIRSPPSSTFPAIINGRSIVQLVREGIRAHTNVRCTCRADL